MAARPMWDIIDFELSERSAARLAHQSGGLGVPGSNPGAPTNKITYFLHLQSGAVPRKIALGNTWGTATKWTRKDSQ